MLKAAIASRDFDEESLSMIRVVKTVQREISGGEFFKFSGTFPTDCQERSVPTSLKSLVSMLLYGSNINDDRMLYNHRPVSQYAKTYSKLQRKDFNCGQGSTYKGP